MAEVDLNHIDGRAKVKALAAPLFARMTEGIYREMLADRLAVQVSMPAAALKKSFMAGDGTRKSEDRPEPSRQSRGRMGVGRAKFPTPALTLGCHHPPPPPPLPTPQPPSST